MAQIKILSEPEEDAAPAPKGTVRIVSEPDYAPSGGFGQRLKSNYMNDVNQGVERMGQPGMFNKAMGALGYAMAPINAAGKTIAGDPAAMLTRNLGGGPEAQRFVGDTANLGAQVFGGGPVAKGLQQAAPVMERAVQAVLAKLGGVAKTVATDPMGTVNKGAAAAGGVLRSTVDAVEDVAGSVKQGRQARKAAAEADAPPTAEDLYTNAGTSFERAKTLGGDIDPEAFATKIRGTLDEEGNTAGSVREALKAQDIDLVNHADNFPETTKMLTALDRMVEGEGVKSFNDLIKLQRALRPYVRRAKAKGKLEGDETDFRAATILKKEIDSFMSSQGDEANAALGEAKELYKRASKMDDIDDIMTKAERLNDPDLLQREFRSLALDDYAMRNFTAAEKKLIDEIAATSRLEDLGEAVLPGKASKLKSAVTAARGAKDGRMTKARELRDLVARGEGAQKAAAAEKAAQPGFSERINKVLRPGPPHSGNRPFPYTND